MVQWLLLHVDLTYKDDFKLVRKAAFPSIQTQAKSQHSEGSALKATFHTNMTQLRGEAIKSRLNVAKTPIVSLIVFVYLHVSLSILQKL